MPALAADCRLVALSGKYGAPRFIFHDAKQATRKRVGFLRGKKVCMTSSQRWSIASWSLAIIIILVKVGSHFKHSVAQPERYTRNNFILQFHSMPVLLCVLSAVSAYIAEGMQWFWMDGAQYTKHSSGRERILQVECRRTWTTLMWTLAHKVVFCKEKSINIFAD